MAVQKGQQGRPKKAVSNKVKETPQKVVEVTTKKTEEVVVKKQPKPVENRNLFDVKVKGNWRKMSKSAAIAVSKDPRLKVEVPKGSILEKILEPPCKDC